MSLLQSKTFLTRRDAANALREAGIPVRDSTLESGKGPPYRLINGRALYLRDEIETWLQEQVRSKRRHESSAA